MLAGECCSDSVSFAEPDAGRGCARHGVLDLPAMHAPSEVAARCVRAVVSFHPECVAELAASSIGEVGSIFLAPGLCGPPAGMVSGCSWRRAGFRHSIDRASTLSSPQWKPRSRRDARSLPMTSRARPLAWRRMRQPFRSSGSDTGWTTEVDCFEGDRTSESMDRQLGGAIVPWRSKMTRQFRGIPGNYSRQLKASP